MAIKVYNGTNWDDVVGSASIGGTNVSVTAAGITSLGNTAPNLVNQAVGVLLAVVSLPSSSNFIVELLESGVVKATETINLADMKQGYMYVRFATPYTFATLTAGAYTVRVKSSSGTQGVLRTITAGNLWNQIVYDTNGALGATDDAWIGGYVQNAGVTTKTLTISGTSNSWGSGADTAMVSTTQWTMGAATTIFQGGSLVFDTTASTTLTQLGSIVPYRGGLFDMRAGTDMTKINTLSFNQQATDGRFGILHPGNGLSGQVLTTGKTVSVYTTRGTGSGTAADPWIPGIAIDSVAGDEVVFGGATDYLKNERKYIKTRNSSTSFVLSDTVGGAEAALTQTHSSGSYVGLMTRNSIIKNTTTTAGFWIMNFDSNTSPVSSYNYTRLEYSNCLSSKGIAWNGASTTTVNGNDATHDGVVIYNNSAAARNSSTLTGVAPQTITGVILYNTRGTNYSAQSGYVLASCSNKTINYLLHFADPSSTTNAAGLSLNAAVSNTINHFHSYGANANNGGAGYALGLFSSFNNTFNDSTIDSSRIQGIYYYSSLNNTFNNMSMGAAGTNAIDIFTVSSTYNTALFNSSSFASATLLSNYLNQLTGSKISFHEMDGNVNKHRAYAPTGSNWSGGAGLTETTVRTASSLSYVMNPENNSTGHTYETLIPAVPSTSTRVSGYIYRNASFSSGTLKVELFLPGSTTADATYTFPTTTLTWLPFDIAAYYSGSTTRFARVLVTAVSSTAGARAILDDMYDAGTGNKLAGFDAYYRGEPSPIMLVTDFNSAIPSIAAATATEVWDEDLSTHTTAGTSGKKLSDIPTTTYTVPTAAENADAVWDEALSGHSGAGSAGKVLNDAEANTDVTQAKIDQLS